MKQAQDFLREAASVIEERGKLRDKENGERSMLRAVSAYRMLRDNKMDSELDGWLFMCILKMARATAGKTHEDDWTDLCGYAALGAECASREKRHEALDELARIDQELDLYDSSMNPDLNFDKES